MTREKDIALSSGNATLPLVSVVIPIYNVLYYVDRGVNEILRQTYDNFEIILVDDGSLDGSAERCDYWARSSDKIRALHKPNGGAGSARNMGIEAVRGKYVYFFDIDDKADKRLLAYCVAKMEELSADMMIFGFGTIDVARRNMHDRVVFGEHMLTSNQALRDCYVDEVLLVRNGNGFPWNKFYSTDFLNANGLRFEDQRIQQDEIFNLKAYSKVNRLYISNQQLYTYFIYEKGNTRSHFIPDRLDIYVAVRKAFEALRDQWQLKDPRIDNYLHKRFWTSVVSGLLPNMFHPNCHWKPEQQRHELCLIAANGYTQMCFEYVGRFPLDMEHRTYIHCINSHNLALLRVAYHAFKTFRTVKGYYYYIIHAYRLRRMLRAVTRR